MITEIIPKNHSQKYSIKRSIIKLPISRRPFDEQDSYTSEKLSYSSWSQKSQKEPTNTILQAIGCGRHGLRLRKSAPANKLKAKT